VRDLRVICYSDEDISIRFMYDNHYENYGL
jgi:hypothetical protein